MNDIQLVNFAGDLKFSNGDFVIADSDKQNIHDIINDAKGEWKQYPLSCVGVVQYQNSNGTRELAQAIKTQLKIDGFNVGNPIVKYDTKNQLVIDPDASR